MPRKGIKNIDYTLVDRCIFGYLNSLDGKTTVRHLYYKVIGIQRINYGTLVKHITKLRDKGLIDENKIADYTRKTLNTEERAFTDKEDFFKSVFREEVLAEAYRRKFWEDTPVYFELWIEKEAVSSIVEDICSKYKITLQVSKGFCSRTKIKEAYERFAPRIARDQEVIVLMITDLDEHGELIFNKVKERLENKFSYGLKVERIGLTLQQVKKYNKEQFVKPNTINSYEIDCLEDDELRTELESIFQDYFSKNGIDMQKLIQLEKKEKDEIYVRIQQHKEELYSTLEKVWSFLTSSSIPSKGDFKEGLEDIPKLTKEEHQEFKKLAEETRKINEEAEKGRKPYECKNCGYPLFKDIVSLEVGKREDPTLRLGEGIIICPKCGHKNYYKQFKIQ